MGVPHTRMSKFHLFPRDSGEDAFLGLSRVPRKKVEYWHKCIHIWRRLRHGMFDILALLRNELWIVNCDPGIALSANICKDKEITRMCLSQPSQKKSFVRLDVVTFAFSFAFPYFPSFCNRLSVQLHIYEFRFNSPQQVRSFLDDRFDFAQVTSDDWISYLFLFSSLHCWCTYSKYLSHRLNDCSTLLDLLSLLPVFTCGEARRSTCPLWPPPKKVIFLRNKMMR